MYPVDRLLARLDRSGDCWIWTGAQSNGYGMMRVGPVNVQTHRVAYEAFVGPIPSDQEIDHLCRVKLCANPAHLEAVSHAENVRRERVIRVAQRTHCRHGHELDSDNVYQPPGSNAKVCRRCVRDNGVRYRARMRSAA